MSTAGGVLLKTVTLHRHPMEGLGFSLEGEAPVRLTNVAGAAAQAGLKTDDKLTAVSGEDVSRAEHRQVVKLIADSGTTLMLTVETSSNFSPSVEIGSPVSIDSDSKVRHEQLRKKNVQKARIMGLEDETDASRWCNSSSPSAAVFCQEDGLSRRKCHQFCDTLPPSGSRSRKVKSKMSTVPQPPAPQILSNPSLISSRWSSETNLLGETLALFAPAAAEPCNSLGKRTRHKGRAKHFNRSFSTSSSTAEEGEPVETGFTDPVAHRKPVLRRKGKVRFVLLYYGAVPCDEGIEAQAMVRQAANSLFMQRIKPTTALLSLDEEQILVKKRNNKMVVKLEVQDVLFAAAYGRKSQHFGLCCGPPADRNSMGRRAVNKVCYVFGVDAQLRLHSLHFSYAEQFGFICSRDSSSRSICCEFASSSYTVVKQLNPLLEEFKEKFRRRTVVSEEASSIRTSSYCASSDSGIGGGCRDRRQRQHKLVRWCDDAVEEQEDTLTRESAAKMDGGQLVEKKYALADRRLNSCAAVGLASRQFEDLRVEEQKGAMNEQHAESNEQTEPADSSVTRAWSSQDVGGESNGAGRLLPSAKQQHLQQQQHMSKSTDQMSCAGLFTPQDFESALNDPTLRKPFEDFLTQQFCVENINFYLAVDSYHKAAKDASEFARLGKEIFERHFEQDCAEPINVDAATIHCITDSIKSNYFDKNVFDVAQYQIFHLLKYDCWPRFLQWQAKFPSKAALQHAAHIEARSDTIRSQSSGGSSGAVDQIHGSCEKDKKRRSILPWKNRFSRRKKETTPASVHSASPLKGVGQPEHKHSDGALGGSAGASPRPAAGQRPSLVSLGKQHSVPTDVTLSTREGIPGEWKSRPDVVPDSDPCQPGPSSSQSPSFTCTVFCPQTGRRQTVPIPEGLAVGKWVDRLSRQWQTPLAATGVTDITDGGRVQVSADAIASEVLAGRSIQVEKVVFFQIDFPVASGGRRALIIRARNAESSAGDVLSPVLRKYDIKLEECVIIFEGTTEVLSKSVPINRAHGRKLLVLSEREFNLWRNSDTPCASLGQSGVVSPFFVGPLDSVAANEYKELPSIPGVGVVELSTASASKDSSNPLSGMLKFVRHKGGGGHHQQPLGHHWSQLTNRGRAAAGGGTKDDQHFVEQLSPGRVWTKRRKSLGMLRAPLPTAGRQTSSSSPCPTAAPTSSPSSSATLQQQQLQDRGASVKRQTFTNPQEFRDLVRQDRMLGQLLKRAQANRLDDQSGCVAGTNCDLPDFLKETAAAAAAAAASSGSGGNKHDEAFLEDEPPADESSPAAPPPPRRGGPPALFATSVDAPLKASAALTAPAAKQWQYDYV